MDQEIELKLNIAASDSGKIIATGLFPGRRKSARQTSIYFDTADHALAKSGISLRIRTVRKRKVQTVKITRGSLFRRGEWERSVSDDVPVLDTASPLADFFGDHAEPFVTLFRVENMRTLWMFIDQDAALEIVLDRGEIVANERRWPICELELELKAGNPSVLFDWARHIDAFVPIRIGVISKCEAGYRLIEASGGSIKAEPVVLDSEMHASEAFQHIIRNCLRQYRLNEDVLLAESAPAALHQARVALRRLRSALRLFRPMVKGRRFELLSEDLKWLSGNLGRARDIDVLLSEDLPRDLHIQLHRVRLDAYAKVRSALESPKSRLLMLDIMEWTETGKWLHHSGRTDTRDTPVAQFAQERLETLFTRILRSGHDLDAMLDSERHALRKQVKKLRYSAEFFARLYTKGKSRKHCIRFLATLEDVQDRLGALTDQTMRRALLKELGIKDAVIRSEERSASASAKMLRSAQDAMENLNDIKKFWREK